MSEPLYMNIGAVERDTGIGKDSLRVWERRYGFPQPLRDGKDERLYPPDQVARLHLIKRLLDQGYRPGKLIPASAEALKQLCADEAPPAAEQSVTGTANEASAHASASATEALTQTIATIIDRIKNHELLGLRQTLVQTMARQGLQAFLLDTMGPLNNAVGDAWMRGELQVFEEHLYSEQIKALLRQAIASLPPSGETGPRILLTTVPDELHVLGLLMVESLFTLDGATCISLGTQTPLSDICDGAAAHRADIVALSFSAAFPVRRIAPTLKHLRALLPASVALWVGGSGALRMTPVEGVAGGVLALPSLGQALDALRAWRQSQAAVNGIG